MLNIIDSSRVAVVYGRDESLRASMYSFLRAIGLKPIEWSQAIDLAGEPAPLVPEILARAFQSAQAVVVVLSGDDEARLRDDLCGKGEPEYERVYTPQARPNVLFEAGMAFGTHPDRTVLVAVGTLRPFSDIAGRHVIRLNNSPARRQELAQRIKLAGCPVDLSGIDWHSVGNFDKPESVVAREASRELLDRPHDITNPRLAILAAMGHLQDEKMESGGSIDSLISVEAIARRVNMRKLIVEHHIHDFLSEKLVHGSHVGYALTKKGRDVIVRQNLI